MIKEILTQLAQHKRNVLSQIASLQSEVSKIEEALGSLASIAPDGGSGAGMPSPFKAPKAPEGKTKGGMSAEGRERIAAAQKARWAKINAGKPAEQKPANKRKNKISPEGLARIKAAQSKR